MGLGPLLGRGEDLPGVGQENDALAGPERPDVDPLPVLFRNGPQVVVLVEFRPKIDLHLSAPQGAQVLLHISLAGVNPGHQEPDHERGVEDLAEPEGLGDIERDSPRRGRRHLPVKQRVQALVLAEAQAREFIENKVQKYFKEFHDQEGSSAIQVGEINQENSQILQEREKFRDVKSEYENSKEKVSIEASEVNLDREHVVDKTYKENAEKIILEKSQEINQSKENVERNRLNTEKMLKKNQSEIRKKTGISNFNKLEEKN